MTLNNLFGYNTLGRLIRFAPADVLAWLFPGGSSTTSDLNVRDLTSNRDLHVGNIFSVLSGTGVTHAQQLSVFGSPNGGQAQVEIQTVDGFQTTALQNWRDHDGDVICSILPVGFVGPAPGITAVPAASLTGTLNNARLSGVALTGTDNTFSGTVTATGFAAGAFVVDTLGNVVARSFLSSPPVGFHLNPTHGSDANDGLTPATAWKTDARLATAIAAATPGVWRDLSGNSVEADWLTNGDRAIANDEEFKAGLRVLDGPRLFLDTTDDPFVVTQPLNFLGWEVGSAVPGQKARIRHRLPIPGSEVWTRPNAGTYPHVWGTAGTTYANTIVQERLTGGWAQLTQLTAADLAAALPTLESTPGSSYPDPATGKLYVHAIAGGNPNTDGVARQYSPFYDLDHANNGTHLQLTGCYAHDLDVDAAPTYDPTTGVPQGAYAAGVLHNPGKEKVTVWQNCTFSGGAKHTLAWVGGDGSDSAVRGHLCLIDVKLTMAAGGFGPNAQNVLVFFADYANTNKGRLTVNVENPTMPEQVAALGAAGAAPAADTTSVFMHNNGGSGQFLMVRYKGAVLPGQCLLGDVTAREIRCEDSTFSNAVRMWSPKVTVTASRFDYQLPSIQSASALVEDSIMTGVNTTARAAFAGAPLPLSGNVTFRNCTIDADPARCVPNASAWMRSGGLALTLDSCAPLLGAGNVIYGLVAGMTAADTFAATKSLVGGYGSAILFKAYNGGADKLVSDAVTATWIDGTCVLKADPAIDFTQVYKPLGYSAALALATVRHDRPDFTGRIFGWRDTAGAVQWDGAEPLPAWTADDPGYLARVGAGVRQYQDAAGTTPVTAPAQPVGLWLDPGDTPGSRTRPYRSQASNASRPASSASGGVNCTAGLFLDGPNVTRDGTTFGGDTTYYFVFTKEAGKGFVFAADDAGAFMAWITDDGHVTIRRPDTATGTVAYTGPDSGLILGRLVRVLSGGLEQWIVTFTGMAPALVVSEFPENLTFGATLYGGVGNLGGYLLSDLLCSASLLGTAADLRILAEFEAEYGVTL